MASYAQPLNTRCLVCEHAFTASIWLIVDASERPDLVERTHEDRLHHKRRCV